MAPKTSFLDRVLGRIGRLDPQGMQTVLERLARERAFLEMLFNTIEDGVLVVDEAGRILYFNEGAVRLLNLPPDGADGEPITKFLPELDWKRLSKLDIKGGPRVVRHEFEIAYPEPRFVRLYAAPLDGDSKGSSGLALILHDATEARQETFEAIESERIQALTLLAASVAHEIGNPLNALHIHLQLITRESKKLRQALNGGVGEGALLRGRKHASPTEAAEILDKVDGYLDVAKGEITRLDYIITQFLQAIRPTKPNLHPESLNDVVVDTLNLLRPEMENRGIAVQDKCARQLAPAPLDVAQIKQALVNLVKNAMQAMSKDGVLTMATGQTNEGVWVSVTDSGGGIPPEQINRIFEPFYTTKTKGTGLGLMIVQRIVREHGGRIELESNVGRGTVFRMWFPLAERQPKLLAGPTSPSSGGAANP